MLNFPIAIHKDADSDYGVTVPDLPGCFTAGKTLDDALAMAREAIELHLEGLIEAGEPIPAPRSVEHYKGKRDFAGATWAVVTVNAAALGQRATRVTFTIPVRMLRRIDRYAKRIGESRSGVLIRGAAQLIGESPVLAKRGRPKTVKMRRA
jgi:predicted RNase H-like HicB family nuclease